MKLLKAKSYSDWSKGVWQSISSATAPENSVKLALNMNSDIIHGELISRKGSTLVGTQIVDNATVLGLHNYRGTVAGTTDKLFAVVSDGVHSDIYDVVAGTKSLEDDTKDLKTRFLTYLDSCLRLNGTDFPAAYNGTTWIVLGGVFDLAAIPTGSKYAIEFKDRICVAGRLDSPDRVDLSSIADSTTRTVNWTIDGTESGAKFFVSEQEDGGGGITGLAKAPGYLMIFKKRTLKRYDGTSAYPEDLVNQGAPSQEAIAMAKGMVFWVNENDAWMSTGGDPKAIGSFMVRDIIKSIVATNLVNVSAGTDEEHVFWSIPSCTINGETYTNVVLKYNILMNTWDIHQYPTLITRFCKTVDTDNATYITYGNNDGQVLVLNSGNTDNGTGITFSVETQDWDFGFRLFQKGINRFGIVTEGLPKSSEASVMWRNTHNPGDWKSLGTIKKDVQDFSGIDLRGNFYNFKVTETVTSGQATFIGFEFPEGIRVYDNTE